MTIPRPTRRGIAVLALAVGTYLAARTLGTWELYLVAYALPAIVCIAWVLVLVAGGRLTATRSLLPDQPTADDELIVRVRVTNASLAAGPQVTVTGATGDLDDDEHMLEVESLRPRAERIVEATIKRARRGVFDLPRLLIETEDPLGLVRAVRETGEPQTVTVPPRLIRLESCVALTSVQGDRRRSRRGHARLGGTELRGVRPHYPGEPLNHVDWKATARTGSLMLREMDDPTAGDVAIVLDGTRAAGRTAREDFELAVRAAGSLADFALRAGWRVDLLLYEAEWRTTALVPGAGARERLLESLAATQPDARESLATALRRISVPARHHAQVGGWTIVARSLDKELVRALLALRRESAPVSVVLVPAGDEPTAETVTLASAGIPCLTVRNDDDLTRVLAQDAAARPGLRVS